MAVSEVASFPNNNIPVVNILAIKCGFRPIFYWRAYDVLVTTEMGVPLRLDNDQVDIRGLLMLFITFQVHRSSSCILFDQDVLQSMPTSGWAAALENCATNTLGRVRVDQVNSGIQFVTAPSDSRPESSDGDSTPATHEPTCTWHNKYIITI